MTKEQKHKNFRSIVLSSVLIISLFSIIVSTSLAWFTNNSTDEVSTISMKTDLNDDLMIEEEDGKWKAGISTDLGDDIHLEQITSDGNSFMEPVFEAYYMSDGMVGHRLCGYYLMDEEALATVAVVTKFKLRTSHSQDLYLSPQSNVTGKDYSDTRRLCSANYCENSSDRFSIDYIVGAIRVGFYTYDTENEKYDLKLLWIPNPQIDLIEDQKGYYTLNPNSDESQYEEDVIYVNARKENMNVSQYEEYSGVDVIIGTIPTNYEFATLPVNKAVSFKTVVWLDGLDRECKDPLIYSDNSNGLLDILLKFTTLRSE